MWSPERVAVLKALWSELPSVRGISNEMQETQSAIWAQASRLGLPSRLRCVERPLSGLGTRWNQSETDQAIALWREGKTANEIGRILGRSKNSVVGRLNRLPYPRAK